MAESTLSIDFEHLMQETSFYCAYGRRADQTAGLTASQETEIQRYVDDGYRQFLFPPPLDTGGHSHRWSFIYPVTTIAAWATVTGTTSGAPTTFAGTVTGVGTYSTTTGRTTMTIDTAIMDRALLGKSFVFDTGGGTYVISRVASSTSCELTGDASGETTGDTFTITGVSKVTATAAKFFASMEGATFTFDTSTNGYAVLFFVSTTVMYLDGDATGEASGDTFTITANGRYRLPDDFGDLYGQLTFPQNDGYYPALDVISEGRVRTYLQETTSTARPYLASVRPLTSTGALGQRFDLYLFPIPDVTYTLSYRYQVLVDALSATNRYPLGGMQHADTIKASCLAVAERGRTQTKGEKWDRFIERLRASISMDRNQSAKTLGFWNTEPGTWRGPFDWRRNHVTTVYGVAYP